MRSRTGTIIRGAESDSRGFFWPRGSLGTTIRSCFSTIVVCGKVFEKFGLYGMSLIGNFWV